MADRPGVVERWMVARSGVSYPGRGERNVARSSGCAKSTSFRLTTAWPDTISSVHEPPGLHNVLLRLALTIRFY